MHCTNRFRILTRMTASAFALRAAHPHLGGLQSPVQSPCSSPLDWSLSSRDSYRIPTFHLIDGCNTFGRAIIVNGYHTPPREKKSLNFVQGRCRRVPRGVVRYVTAERRSCL